MTQAEMTVVEKQIRLFIYEFVLRFDRCPSLNEIATEAGLAPLATQQALERLDAVHTAIVLLPGSGNLWLADPFAALPTPYPAITNDHSWFGMCVWDALGILAIADVDGHTPCICPISGKELDLRVVGGELTESDGVVHFAVPASEWWKDIGYT